MVKKMVTPDDNSERTIVVTGTERNFLRLCISVAASLQVVNEEEATEIWRKFL